MQLIEKIDHALALLEQLLIVGLFAALILFISLHILSRNLLGASSQKLLELVPAMVMWLALLGATLGLKHQRHIKLEVLLRHLSPGINAVARSVTNGCGALLMAVLFAASLTFVHNEIGIFGAWGWVSVIFPVFFALATFRFIIAAVPTDDGRASPHPRDVKSSTNAAETPPPSPEAS